jgi:hypothetical protein
VTISVAGTLFTSGNVLVRPVLLRRGVQVGRAGMALDGKFDSQTNCVELTPGRPATVGMLLQSEEEEKVRVMVLDPATDAVLAQSNDISVKLAI